MTTELTVMQAKRFGVEGCRKDATLMDAAQRMVRDDISALVVEDANGNLAGIITRMDLLRALVDSADWMNERVADYMNPDVVTISTAARIADVARLLVERQIHRLVVVREEDGQKKPIGVVSAADVVYHMSK